MILFDYFAETCDVCYIFYTYVSLHDILLGKAYIPAGI
jgi:hypothetical protein